MNDGLARRTGSALAWKIAQLAGSQSIQLLRVLILARLLAPEDFGLLAIAMVTIRTLLALTDVGMLQALVQRPHPAEGHYDAGWTVGVLRGTGIAIVVAAGSPLIAAAFAEPEVTPILAALALKPALDSLVSVKTARLMRDLQFRSLALMGLSMALADTLVAVALAPSIGVWALVAGVLAGSLANLTVSYVVAPHRPRLVFDRTLSAPLVRFGRWILATGVVAVAGSALLQVLISRTLGAAALGLYYMAVRIATVPEQLVSQVVGGVAFPVFSKLQNDPRRAARAFREILSGAAILQVPVYTVLLVMAPALVSDVLGADWGGAGPPLQLLAAAGILGVLGSVAAPVLNGVGHPKRSTALEAAQSLLLIVGAALLVGPFGLNGAVAAWIPAIVASQLLALVYVSRLLPGALRGLAARFGALAAASAAGAALSWQLLRVLHGAVATLAAAGGSLALILLLLWLLDRFLALGLAEGLVRVFPLLARVLRYGRGMRDEESLG